MTPCASAAEKGKVVCQRQRIMMRAGFCFRSLWFAARKSVSFKRALLVR